MPATKPNRKLRVIVPLFLTGVVIGLVVLAIVGGGPGRNAAPNQQGNGGAAGTSTAAPAPAASAGGGVAEPPPAIADPPPDVADADAGPRDAPPAEPTPDNAGVQTAGANGANAPTPPAAPAGLRARPQNPTPSLQTLGALDPATGDRLEIEFTLAGAGVARIRTTDYFETLAKAEPVTVQSQATFGDVSLTPFATVSVTIDGVAIGLHGSSSAPVWRESSRGVFVAEIVDENDVVAAVVTKRYTLPKGELDFRLTYELENRTARAMQAAWVAHGPIDFPKPPSGYGGDLRRLRVATLANGYVAGYDRLISNDGEIRAATKAGGRRVVYPSERFPAGQGLVWAGVTSRYFTTTMYPDLPDGATAPAAMGPVAALDQKVYPYFSAQATGGPPQRLIFEWTGPTFEAPAGGAASSTFRVYAGPLDRAELTGAAGPAVELIELEELIVYNFGGPCAMCTFAWLARPLLGVLTLFHAVVHDWALSIMMLVVCVRALLHPITRKSQIGMMRFGKQMQRVQPKLKKLQEKYKGDPKRLQQEQVRLMREEGVNYANMLGCLPMFMQTPIWIALYAMLYFLFDLRHEGAFFGAFQAVTGGAWPFLADMGSADRFIPIPAFRVPVISNFMGEIDGINLLPILLGFVYFFQQKYLTPPRTGTMTPEQEAQQKMMKVIIVVLFPLIIYNAPAGLAVYFITNSSLGILEGAWIRAHVNKEDLDAPPKPKRQLVIDKNAKKEPARANPFQKDRDRKRFKDRR